MAKSKMKIRLNRKTIFSGMFIVSLLFMMISVSFSWFIDSDVATVNVGTVNIEGGETLLIKKTTDSDDSWRQRLVMNTSEEAPQTLLQPIAGNGEIFFAPDHNNCERNTDNYETTEDGYKVYGDFILPLVAIQDDLSTYAYVFDFEAKLTHSDGISGLYDLKLVAGSDISPSSPDETAHKAIRVAFLQKNEEENFDLTCLWAPHDTQITVVSAAENGEEIITTATTQKIYALSGMTESISIGQLTANAAASTEFRVIVWLDGNDAECINAISAEQFSVELNLEAVKNESETE